MDISKMQNVISEQLLNSKLPQAIMHEVATRAQYRAYLIDVYHYACHSSQVIGMAAARLVLTHPKMAAYLFRHAEEELGHDKWAAADLRDLGLSDADIENSKPSDACIQMIALEYLYAAHLNPVGLFGWMFALESLGAHVGGNIAKMLNKTLALNDKGLYFLTGHADADATHAIDLATVIAEGISCEEDRLLIEQIAYLSKDLYIQILDHACSQSQATR
jgi:pyrroloquinoline quinone (PQQ) biosynthesis protein C